MKRTFNRMILYCILFIGLVAGITAILFPYFKHLSDPVYQDKICEWSNSMGIVGVLAILGLQIVQIIIAFIPGEPVELLAGVLYGTGGGLILCLVGCMLASSIVFSLSKRFGKKLLYVLFRKENVESWKWLQDTKKCTLVTFLLFLIPGTPKDMLTYIVGVTNMGIGEFLAISSLARIPSVLSSTMIGATMSRGNWKVSLLVFLITGVIGIMGIGMKEKVIEFCRRHSGREACVGTPCACTDMIEAAHRNKIYPLIYCHAEILGHLDINRLKTAIKQASHYVPEIMYTYNFKYGRFTDAGFTADDIILFDKTLHLWDLGTKSQLQISIERQENTDYVTIGMSHILTDGNGFLQFLYLLSALYRDPYAKLPYKNQREIAPFLENIHVQKPTEQTQHGKREKIFPIRNFNNGTEYFFLISRLSKDDFLLLHEKATENHATLNDVFLTAYARVNAQIKSIKTIILPCPADLRRFHDAKDGLTIANLTGMYRKVVIEVEPQNTFSETLSQVHLEMELQKSRRRCYEGIRLLNTLFHKLPYALLQHMIKERYQILPVSYTNIGKIDDRKFRFDDCTVKSCYITGTYRQSPDFQLSISTFRDECTLNCTLIGLPEDEQTGPSLRGDQIVSPEKSFVETLSKQTKITITGLEDFKQAISVRLREFSESGCRFSDHALDNGFVFYEDDGQNEKRFQRILNNELLDKVGREKLISYLLLFLGEEYARYHFVMQLHIGAQRFTSTRLRTVAGAAGGFACIGNSVDVVSLTNYFDKLEQGKYGLPRMILFTLNPADNALVSVLSGSYSKDNVAGLITQGPAWWWCDHKYGICEVLENEASFGVLSNFVGMTTDSRSFLSFVRHDYFRRVLCKWVGEKARNQEITDSFEALSDLVIPLPRMTAFFIASVFVLQNERSRCNPCSSNIFSSWFLSALPLSRLI